MNYIENPNNLIYSFKVEFLMNGRIFFERYNASTLGELSELIVDNYPNAKVISIVGG
jgi:hypothetical protein